MFCCKEGIISSCSDQRRNEQKKTFLNRFVRMVHKVVLVRHGESTWNKENRFTGWEDVELSETGVQEAHLAAKLLKEGKFEFDVVYTSYLKRAINTMNLILTDMDRLYLPVIKSWRLNERHYGALQGLNKSETAAKHGEEQVKIWRRSYDIPPPALEESDPRYPGNDSRYKDLKPEELPKCESLKSTVDRFLPYWHDVISKDVAAGKRVLIVAHGNSLRALVKYLDNIPESEIVELNIPTAVPLVYELDDQLKSQKHYYLGDQDEIAKKMAAVANQGKSK